MIIKIWIMYYKDKLKEIFSILMDDGLEGAIPTFIVEVLESMAFKHNHSTDMISALKDQCEVVLNN